MLNKYHEDDWLIYSKGGESLGAKKNTVQEGGLKEHKCMT